MAASSAGHKQQQQQPATLKSSVARLARLFLGKSRSSHEARQQQQQKQRVLQSEIGDKLEQASDIRQLGVGLAWYGSLAREPSAVMPHSFQYQSVSQIQRYWRSQDRLANCDVTQMPIDYDCDDSGGGTLMSQSVHAGLACSVEPEALPKNKSEGYLLNASGLSVPAGSSSRLVGVECVSSADLASLVRAKQSELDQLRCTMERNEAALMRVFEERRADLESRLESERAFGAELAPAVAQANQRARQSDQALAELRAVVEQRRQESRLLRSRLHAIEADSRQKAELELQLSMSSGCGGCVASESRSCQASIAADDSLELHITAAKAALEEQTRSFAAARNQWLAEKCQVLAYQKQLQLNLVQLRNKTTRLAADVEQLNSELAAKDSLLQRRAQETSNCLSGMSEC